MRSLNLIAVVALGLIAVVRVATAWDELPERMASHFDAAGRPDGWTSRSGFLLLYGAVAVLTVFALSGARVWLRWLPADLINVPHRAYWFAPERRAESLQKLTSWMEWLGTLTAGLLFVILEDVIRANLEGTSLGTTGFLTVLGIYLAAVAVLVVKLVRDFRRPPEAAE